MSFSKDDDTDLCEIICGYPALYDSSHKDYKDVIVKNDIWKEIAVSMGKGKTDTNCKGRWRTIRDHYKRLKREGKLETESAGKKSANWSLLNSLSFLSHVREEISTRTNIPEIYQYEELSSNNLLEDLNHIKDEDCRVTSPSISSPSPASDTTLHSSKKRKLNKCLDVLIGSREAKSKLFEALNDMSQEQDDINTFYKSIALSVKRLPPILKAEAKLQHLQTLNNLELKHMQNSQQYQQYIIKYSQ